VGKRHLAIFSMTFIACTEYTWKKRLYLMMPKGSKYSGDCKL